MKKVLNSTKTFAIILMVCLTVAVSAQSFVIKGDNPSELKYIGTVNNHPRLLLTINNVESDEFVVTITDQSNAPIFTENLYGKLVTRTYQLDTDEFDASVLNFHVYSKKNNSTVVYKVNNNQRFVQDVVINKK